MGGVIGTLGFVGFGFIKFGNNISAILFSDVFLPLRFVSTTRYIFAHLILSVATEALLLFVSPLSALIGGRSRCPALSLMGFSLAASD